MTNGLFDEVFRSRMHHAFSPRLDNASLSHGVKITQKKGKGKEKKAKGKREKGKGKGKKGKAKGKKGKAKGKREKDSV